MPIPSRRPRRVLLAAVLALCAPASAQMYLSSTLGTSAELLPGSTATFWITLVNQGPFPETIWVGTNDAVVVQDPSGQVVFGGDTVYFYLDVPVATGAYPGTVFSPYLFVSTNNGGFVSLSFTASVLMPEPALIVHQPAGPGGPTSFQTFFAYVGYEYWTIFSLEPAQAGPGSGPYLGLFATDVNFLLAQISAPLGSLPFHYQGDTLDGLPVDLGTYGLPLGLTFEALILYPRLFPPAGALPFQWTNVTAYTVQ